MQKATIFVEGVFTPGYERYFVEYSRKIMAYLERHDAVVVRRQRVRKMLYGSDGPDLVMLIDFPDVDVEAAERIFFEPEYVSLIPLRQKVFTTFKMCLVECNDPAYSGTPSAALMKKGQVHFPAV
jgi:uncharacterized protein (DUF1330 family)